MPPDRPRPPSVERLLTPSGGDAPGAGRIPTRWRPWRARSSPTNARGSRPVRRRPAWRRWRTSVRGPPRRVRRSAPERPDAGPQRDRGDPPHEPRAGARGRPRRSRRRRGPRAATRCSSSTATTGRRGPRFRAAEDAPHRADRRGGRARHGQQRRGPRPRGRAGRATRRRGVARRARRDRRRRPDPRDRPAGRGAAGRGRDDEPDAGRRLRRPARRGPGDGRPPRPSVELRAGRLRGGARPGRGRARSPTSTARSSSTTSGAARCSTPPRFGLAHEPMPARAARGRRGPRHVQRRQAASAGRRPG